MTAPDSSGPEAPVRIGGRLKEARLRARITLDALAETCGVTKGYLSKLERDRVNASVATLVKVCAALNVPVGSLFDDPPAGDLVRADAQPRIVLGGENMTEYVLTPTGERRIQVLLSHIHGDGGSGSEPYELPIDVNVVHVVEGGLRVSFAPDGDGVGAGDVVLAVGDTFTFSPRRRHRFASEGGGPTRLLWVLSPALPIDNPGNMS